MDTLSLEQVIKAAEQLTPAEQVSLISRLQARQTARVEEMPSLGLLIFDVGPWPENLTLRREDEYGDQQR